MPRASATYGQPVTKLPPRVHTKPQGVLTFIGVEKETPEAVKLKLESGRSVWLAKAHVIGGWVSDMKDGGAVKVPGWLAERL
jgi:hypothetical protein